MAALDTNRTFAPATGFAARTLASLNSVVGSLAVWNDARVTRAALSKLSDRELDDIGLSRSDVYKL